MDEIAASSRRWRSSSAAELLTDFSFTDAATVCSAERSQHAPPPRDVLAAGSGRALAVVLAGLLAATADEPNAAQKLVVRAEAKEGSRGAAGSPRAQRLKESSGPSET